jgi:glycerophosphoryl diester phosphodiesterase
VRRDPARRQSHHQRPPDLYRGVGHKGVEHSRPGNTASSYTLAALLHLNGETDVQYSSDGVPVIMHDHTVNDTTDGTGNVRNLTAAQLTALRATHYAPWNTSPYANERVPTLAEVLAPMVPSGRSILLDMHAAPTFTDWVATRDAIRAAGMDSRVIVMSNPEVLANVRVWSPTFTRMIIEYLPATTNTTHNVRTPSGWGRTADSVLATSLLYALPLRSMSQSVVNYYRNHGIRFFVWTTDNPAQDNTATWASLIKWGVSDIITSDPAGLTAYLGPRACSGSDN